MLASEEAVSKGNLSRRKPGREVGKKKQQRSGADGHLQRTVLDAGGFQ
jgi:hypothetical protein